MKIRVLEQPKKFYFATKFIDEDKYEWKPVIGHEVQLDDLRFFIAPVNEGSLNVSEVTTGCRVFEMMLNPLDILVTETKESTLEFYRHVVAVKLKNAIEKVPNFKERLILEQEKQRKLLGEMPPIEEFDETIITEPISELMN